MTLNKLIKEMKDGELESINSGVDWLWVEKLEDDNFIVEYHSLYGELQSLKYFETLIETFDLHDLPFGDLELSVIITKLRDRTLLKENRK